MTNAAPPSSLREKKLPNTKSNSGGFPQLMTALQ
jgi:hypothetical protein